MRPAIFLPACTLLVGLASGAVFPCNARTNLPQAESTKENCAAAIDQARSLAAALPSGDLSRYFAERYLQQAMTEAATGEFDDCLDLAERATDEVQQRRHVLQPGESLKILQDKE